MATKKKTEKFDLFEAALKIDGEPPIEITVGGTDLTIRRAHTGLQVADFHRVEQNRLNAVRGAYETADQDGAEATAKKVAEIAENYPRELLRSLTVEGTKDEDIEAAAEKIFALPTESRNGVYRQLARVAGVVNEDGTPLVSGLSS